MKDSPDKNQEFTSSNPSEGKNKPVLINLAHPKQADPLHY